jgi:CRP-like cAMP-binding protein
MSLPAEDLDSLAADLRPRTFDRGDVVFVAGRHPTAVWIVRSGSLGLFAGSGGDRVILSVLRSGDLDGDLGILLGMPSPYTAEALEPTTCLEIDAAVFDRVFTSRPALARRWLVSLAERLASSQRRTADLLGVPLVEQVARILLDEGGEGQVPYSQGTIAALLGARRPSVNRVVRDLQRRRLISVGYRSITIEDRAGLHAASGRGAAPGR